MARIKRHSNESLTARNSCREGKQNGSDKILFLIRLYPCSPCYRWSLFSRLFQAFEELNEVAEFALTHLLVQVVRHRRRTRPPRFHVLRGNDQFLPFGGQQLDLL